VCEEWNTISNNVVDLLKIPYKIIYYHRRKETIINKTDLKFDNIIKMTQSRLGTTLNKALTAMIESEIVACKQKGAIEFSACFRNYQFHLTVIELRISLKCGYIKDYITCIGLKV